MLNNYTNYHTHTSRCHHAVGTNADYVAAAVENGYTTLGFSDHCPWPFTDWFHMPVRMLWNELPEYIASVRELGELNKDKIEILCGLECEFFPNHTDALKELRSQVDYLILGQHYDTTAPNEVYFGDRIKTPPPLKYLELCVDGMATGHFACLAHPDMFLLPYSEFTPELAWICRELCRAARSFNIPIEYNLYGVRKLVRPEPHISVHSLGYPNLEFWRIAAEEGAAAIIGVDAHDPKALRDPELVLQASMFLDALGVRRVERLEIK
ncbi:histidinol-phosphatase [Clostridia bacterium]|nr:histidinol-phosphatase [Clostridia bacterium]